MIKKLIICFLGISYAMTSSADVISVLGIDSPAGSSITVNSNSWDTVSSSPIPVFDGSYLRSHAPGSNLTITFGDLVEHTSLNIGLLVAQLESLDPVRDGDTFDIYLDGSQLVRVGLGFGSSGGFFDPVVSNYIAAGDPSAPESLVTDTLIWTNPGGFADHAYDFGQLDVLNNIAHTGSSATLTIIGRSYQGWPNEAYAIDNLSLSLNGVPVPTPSNLALLLLGIGLLLKRRPH